jgi:hypothetical protein
MIWTLYLAGVLGEDMGEGCKGWLERVGEIWLRLLGKNGEEGEEGKGKM